MAPSIVVPRPMFPTYLLPSFNIPFRHRTPSTSTLNPHPAATPDANQVPSLSSCPTSSTADDAAGPPPSPPSPTSYRAVTTNSSPATPGNDPFTTTTRPARNRPSPLPCLARTQPDTLRCSTCSCDVAFSSQIVSKGFTGRYGRAYLVAPPPISSGGSSVVGSLANVRIGKCESRQLVTGWHVVADITCVFCGAKLGWKYVDAKELGQKYKVGKFILEVERVVPFRSWEDVPSHFPDVPESDDDDDDDDDDVDGCAGDNAAVVHAVGSDKERGPGTEDVEIVFDSEDEDDLEDLFSGNWDPQVVAKRRSYRVTTARGE